MVPTSLYRFYDAEDRLLYVGVTSVGPSRWSDHERNREWWAKVVRTVVEHFPDRATALDAEREAVVVEQPIYNTVHRVPPRPRAVAGKRKAGTGGINQMGDGRWRVHVREDGRHRQWSIRTEAAARLMLAAVEARYLPRADRERAIALLQEQP